MENIKYHIFCRYAGSAHSGLSSLTDDNARALWDRMVLQSQRAGFMAHPDSGVRLDFASLQYGGQLDKFGVAHGGMMCKKWEAKVGIQNIFEPEPEMYNVPPAPPVEVPDQPEPVSIDGTNVYSERETGTTLPEEL